MFGLNFGLIQKQIDVPNQRIPLGLPKVVNSLCPRCKNVIKANVLERGNEVWMEKSCEEHGFFEDLLAIDKEFYLKIEKWSFEDGQGVLNPQVSNAVNCPSDCGLCNNHKSHTVLANVDLTNRCNLRCPICFANANVQGYVYELSFDQIKKTLETLSNEKPVPCVAVQYSGGEPTIHPRFLDAVKLAKDMGFTHIQIASNGITMANSLDFTKKSAEAGLHTIYLQFDGTGELCYKKTRGVDIWKLKKKAVENIRKAGMKICLVPTIVNNVNNDQVGNILRFAIENSDVISAISYQPVALTGRIDREERLKKRYTTSHLALDLEKNGIISKEDWYPLSFVSPFSKLLEAINGKPTITITCNPWCGTGTYLVINKKTKEATPIPRFVDVEGIMYDLNRLTKRKSPKILTKYMAAYIFRKHFNEEKAPEGMSLRLFMKLVSGILDKEIGKSKEFNELPYNIMLVMGMHFQDLNNFMVERVQRCVIHYSTPGGRLYPFCTYNAGPYYREMIEKKYSIPLNEWVKNKGKEFVSEGFYE